MKRAYLLILITVILLFGACKKYSPPLSPKAGFKYAFTDPDKRYVQFTDTSKNGVTWVWNFGDPASGTQNTSTQRNPMHQYSSTPGVLVPFIVTLIVINNGGVDTVKQTINVGYETTPTIGSITSSNPTYHFFLNGNFTNVGTDITFDAVGVTGAQSYSWDFGDGGTSTSQNPTYTYTQSSTGAGYPVKLTVTSISEITATSTINLPINVYDGISIKDISVSVGNPPTVTDPGNFNISGVIDNGSLVDLAKNNGPVPNTGRLFGSWTCDVNNSNLPVFLGDYPCQFSFRSMGVMQQTIVISNISSQILWNSRSSADKANLLAGAESSITSYGGSPYLGSFSPKIFLHKK